MMPQGAVSRTSIPSTSASARSTMSRAKTWGAWTHSTAARPTLTTRRARRVTMGYDAAGNQIKKQERRAISVTMGYDAANRLTTEKHSTGKRNTYAYDEVNNRTVMNDSTGRYSTAYDAKNRILQTVNSD